jgi:hypothetical protein
MEAIMKNVFIVGAAVCYLAAAGSANAANPNVPAFSPYALMNVDPYNADGGPGRERRSESGMVEGRAAYVGGVFGRVSARRPRLSDRERYSQLSLSDLGVTASYGYGDDTGMPERRFTLRP